MAIDVLGANDMFVSMLRDSLRSGVAGLEDVPMLLKGVIKDDRWKERRIKPGSIVRFQRFEEFVEARPLEGLGCTVATLRRVCGDDPEALDMLDRAIQATERRGGDRTQPGADVSNTHVCPPRPTTGSRQQALRVLRQKRPDLHQEVLAGRRSPHAAMIEAGFRKPTMTIPCDPVEAARVLRQKFRGKDLLAFIKELRVPKQER
jgi:hypothetical protein